VKAHWTALLVGLAVGAGLGWFNGAKAVGGGRANATQVTGAPNMPFQRFIQR
jgi:hypothetical protein